MKIQPIKPTEVLTKKQAELPDEVIEAFNDLIAEKWTGTKASFTQEEAVEKILSKLPKHITVEHLFKMHWLDVEDIYRGIGWDVEFDQPGFNETYPATFTFKRK